MRDGKLYRRIAVIAVILSLLAGAVVMLVLKRNPLAAYYNLLQGSGLAPKAKYAAGRSMLTDLSSFIDFWTPMIFAALACAVAMKTGLFNIGISGQMLVAGFIATITIGYSGLPAVVAKPLVIIIGLVAGMAVGALIGFLKYKFNINEVVSSIMLNYIAEYIISFFIQTRYVDPVSRQSKNVASTARLTLQDVIIGGYKFSIPLAFVLAVIACAFVKIMLDRTVLGYELKAVGANRTAAGYAGIRVGRSIVVSMAISGALAGLAGVSYYLGYFASIQPKTLISTGFDSIAVCLLGSSDPIGIMFSSFLIEVIAKGSTYMSSQQSIESEIISVITGLILLFSACSAFFMGLVATRKSMAETKRRQELAAAGEDPAKGGAKA
ncbi:MAG: ABC transporter permease [Clostridia bacterium]|nr:ABC transporter permease [Clostridia bacterium]